MDELIQELKSLINTLNDSSVPLWISIVSVFVPIVISIAVAIITIIQNKRSKELQRQLNDKNTELQKRLSDRDVRIQMHTDILKIYDDFCFAQNTIGMMNGKSYLIFSNFSNTNGVCLPALFVNNLNTAVNVLCQATNRAKLLLPENENDLRASIENIFNKYKKIKLKIDEYYYSGTAYNVCEAAWAKMPALGVVYHDYSLLMNNQTLYNTFLEFCHTATSNEIDKETSELLELFEYDTFDKYFEKYLRIDAERGEI